MNDLMTKSFMSYKDLKKQSLKDDAAADATIDLESGDNLASSIELSAADGHLHHFLLTAEEIKESMSTIRTLLLALQASSLQSMSTIRTLLLALQASSLQSKSLHTPSDLRQLRHRINSDITLILRSAKSIADQLASMDRENEANRRLSGSKKGTSVDRTRTAVANGLRMKLKELMMEFQTLRQKMMAEYKENVERRYFTATGEVADEEVIEKIISEGGDGEFVRKSNGKVEIMEAVMEIQDRHSAAKEVERSLLELHQVFLDMAVMVETQGDKMDDIEHHVSGAADYVKDAGKELRKAKEHQRGARKWMCLGIVLLMILMMVVFVPILVSLRSS